MNIVENYHAKVREASEALSAAHRRLEEAIKEQARLAKELQVADAEKSRAVNAHKMAQTVLLATANGIPDTDTSFQELPE